MTKNNNTLLLVAGAAVVGYLMYKRGIIKIPGLPSASNTSTSAGLMASTTPILPPITQLQIEDPNVSPPIVISAPDPTGESLKLF